MDANRSLGEKIRQKQQAFKEANPGKQGFIEFDEEDERLLEVVWDEEGSQIMREEQKSTDENENADYVSVVDDGRRDDSSPHVVRPPTDEELWARINLFNLISLAMHNTAEPLCDEDHEELMACYQ